MQVSDAPVIEISRFVVTVSGPNGSMPASQGFYVALVDNCEKHPAKRLIKGAYGPNVRLALRTLRRVILQDYFLAPALKDAAEDAIDARLETER